ncbi:MFS transporter [Phenylobacterium sp. J367]|uniref:spinster family MFS transporter n=1 Tax=Phenylobacterium sp. J367 TaxID=2898435 RepID=UPI0021515866|nr:MFS transporter [Phenylobacterium sp. J367]MCR5881148.1 MFS transporter [Phenylobacterium sp. J367]
MTSPATAVPAAASAIAAKPGRILALVLLTAVGTTNFMDRQILSVLAEPIRQDLGLTDTQLGLLTGLAFAFFYAIMGVPAAMLADRTNRVRLVGLCCMVWSFFTGACAFANSFVHLAFARFGVGVGEAGGTAPSLSILADYYPPRMRPAIIGLFTANGPLGVFVGASFGGWAAAEYGWRTAFLLVAGVGVIASILLMLFVREPARGGLDPVPRTPMKPQPLGATAKVFISRPTLRWLVVASALAAFVSTGMLAWIPAYLMRVQGMPLTEVAKWFGPAAGICFGIGIAGGGLLVNWASRHSLKAYAWIPRPLDAADRADHGAGPRRPELGDGARPADRADDPVDHLCRPGARPGAEPVAGGRARHGDGAPHAGLQHHRPGRRPVRDRPA